MRDIETHTEDYCSLIPLARALFSEYKPSDWLEGVMKVVEDRWFGCVDSLLDRSVMAQFIPNGIYAYVQANITFAEAYVEWVLVIIMTGHAHQGVR